jgi:uncharacterized protein YndB with AHSA1/START domain
VNATLRTVDGRVELRMERRLAHPPEKVWRALTEPDHLNRWYPFQATELELRVGGRIAFDDGTGTTVEGVVTELDPPRVFAFTQDASAVLQREGDNHLRFELRPDGDGCLLVFTHTFHDRPHAAANAAGWHACFDALDAVVNGRPAEMPPSFVELHEAYAEAFGLDQGSAESTPDGWRVRFERQLMQQPVDKVWATLGADGAAVGGPAPQASTTAEVPSGAVTAIEAPRLLEYDWRAADRPAGRVRWELVEAPSGARIVLTQTGPGELANERSTALAAWRSHLARLARRLQEAE